MATVTRRNVLSAQQGTSESEARGEPAGQSNGDGESSRPTHQRQNSCEAAYLGCTVDYDPNEFENDEEREMLHHVSIYGLIFILLSGTDLAVNFLVFESQVNAEGNFCTRHTYSFNTEKQMMLGSVARCVFTVIYILFVSIDGIYSKYPDAIRYILGGIYYVAYCHILVCVLIDSERADFEYDFMYWCCLFLNVVWLSGHLVLSLLIWKVWAKRVYDALNSEQDTEQGPDAPDKSTSKKDAPMTEDELLRGRVSQRKRDMLQEPVERTVPLTHLIRKLLGWYKSELVWIILGHVLLTLIATAESLGPYYEARTLDVLAGSLELQNLLYPLGMHAVISLVEKILSALRNLITTRVSGRLSVQVRSQLFNNILVQDIGFFDKTRSNEITDRLSSFSDELTSVLGDVESMMSSTVNLVALAAVMFRMSWRLTLVLLMCNIFLMMPAHLQVKYKKALGKKIEKVRVGAGNIGQEAIQCIRTVRTFANEEEEAHKYSEKLYERYRMRRKDDILGPSMATLNQALWIGTRALTLCYGAHLTAGGYMTSGELVSFLVYMRKLFNQFSRLFNWQVSRFVGKFGRVEQLLEYLERKPDMVLDGPLAPDSLVGSIEFKNVSFAYPSRPDSVVLKNINFKVDPGEVVALVGASGSGKSTCIQLLQRFYDPIKGQVLLDDIPLTEYKHKYLHKQMALVSQEPILFARSVYDNIIYGEQNLTTEQVIQAAKDANAHDFIDSLSGKYMTEVGEFGTLLSGGQKQRIAIARAIVRNPRILLLDEATSALDAEAEAVVQDALERNMAGRTVVIVAHRLSTVAKADRVVVMGGGTILEQGPPDDLYKQHGAYYRLVKKQMIKRQESYPETEEISSGLSKDWFPTQSPQLRQRWTNLDQSDNDSSVSND